MKVRPTACWLASLGFVSFFTVVAGARAQTLPAEPIALADGRVTVGGDVSATFGSSDPGFFNYTDYDHSALRMLRIDLAGSAKIGPHVTLLGEIGRRTSIASHRTRSMRGFVHGPSTTSIFKSAASRRPSARSRAVPMRRTTR